MCIRDSIYREYRVFVRVHLWEKRAMDEAAALLGRVVPANMVIDLGPVSYTHLVWKECTHKCRIHFIWMAYNCR